jgi:peptidyl-prolyl cis-trans isomerase C
MRPARLTALVAAFASLAAVATAQTPPTPAAPPTAAVPPAAPTAPTDPVVARVDGEEIKLSDISDAMKGLPEQYRGMPAPVLYPQLLEQLVERKAVAIVARKQGLDKDPGVKREIARAEDLALQNALLTRDISPLVTEAAIHARYDRDVKDKPGEEEVHAEHILVPSEDEAKAVIAELKKGGDFAALAKTHSKDPGSANGGDLGWFKAGDMLPEFSAAAFALKPGQFTETPVKTRFGWHVIKLEERRQAPPPTFEQAHDELRQTMIQEALRKILADATAQVKVERFNMDGAPAKATDTAEPPPAPPKK